jgi:RNA polymerase II subunit A C-terminal domain phosphatase SSU72
MEAHWLLQEEGNIRAYSFGAGTKVRLPGETLQTPHVYEFGTPYTQMYKSVARTPLSCERLARAAHARLAQRTTDSRAWVLLLLLILSFLSILRAFSRDLERANRTRYSRNGMLQMLDRDRQLKESPERWQDHYERYAASADAAAAASAKRARKDGATSVEAIAASADDSDEPPRPRHFDVVITYETRVYEIVMADIEARGHNAALSRNQPTHLLNIDTTDNHAEAAVSAQLTLELVQAIYAAHKQARGGGAGNGDDSDEDDERANGADDDDAGASWEDSIDTIIDEFEQKHGKEVAHTVLFY